MPRKILNGVDGNGKEAVNFADPSAPGSLSTKQYVDTVAQGLRDIKDPVRGTTTTNIAITALIAALVHDGVTYAANDRILLKNQTDPLQNGIWVIGASGTGTRATDADENAEVTRGFATTVLEGTTKGTGAPQGQPITYILNTSGTVTIGTTPLNFVPTGAAAGVAKAAGAGLTEDGSNYNVGQGTGIIVGADTVGIDTATVTRKFAAACVVTTNPQTFTHNLNTSDVQVEIREVAGGAIVMADVTVTDANSVSVNFGGAPAAGQYRVVVQG